MPLVKPLASFARGLEIGRRRIAIAPLEHVFEQPRPDALALPLRIDGEQVQVIQRAVWVVRIERVHQLDHPRRVGAYDHTQPLPPLLRGALVHRLRAGGTHSAAPEVSSLR